MKKHETLLTLDILSFGLVEVLEHKKRSFDKIL
jgi:hypothetical protein